VTEHTRQDLFAADSGSNDTRRKTRSPAGKSVTSKRAVKSLSSRA
jgi:hypothetical protein